MFPNVPKDGETSWNKSNTQRKLCKATIRDNLLKGLVKLKRTKKLKDRRRLQREKKIWLSVSLLDYVILLWIAQNFRRRNKNFEILLTIVLWWSDIYVGQGRFVRRRARKKKKEFIFRSLYEHLPSEKDISMLFPVCYTHMINI